MLLARVFIYGLTAISKYGSLLAISSFLAGLLYLQATVHPFKNNFMNVQESLMLLNLLITHVSQLHNDQIVGLKISQILITISITYFISLLTLHCLLFKCKKDVMHYFKDLYFGLFKLRAKNSFEMSHLIISNGIAEANDSYSEFHDPLIALDK